jgi:hypothetical protein
MNTTSNKTVVGSYTDRNNNTTPTALMVESKITNSLNNLRKELGLSHTRNAYPWWAYALAALTYVDKATIKDLECILSESDINVNLSLGSTLLNNAIDGYAPSKIQREYTGKLPKLVKSMKLKATMNSNSLFFDTGRRPRIFRFVDPVEARNKMITMYPETVHLFNQMDYCLSTGRLDHHLP